MRKSSYLQTLYLQKPWLLILLIAIITTFPWIGLGDFYTEKEPHEAIIVVSMLHDSNWLVHNNLDYKLPLNHWLIAGFSCLFNKGEVTPFTSLLPSVLGFVGLTGVCFLFFARRRSTLEAFIACLIIITCFEIHRAAITTHVDMLLTFFIVTGLIQLYVWHEKKENRYLISSWIFLTLATLIKGPIVGIVLPCIIFAVYLLINNCNIFKVIARCLLVVIPSLIVPAIWYVLVYKTKGDESFHLIFTENLGDLSSIGDGQLNKEPWWFYFVSVITGFIPQMLLMVISLFFLKYTKTSNSIKQTISDWWLNLKKNKVQLFSFLVIVIIFVFFTTVPSSKRSVYIMPLYPFVALFMSQYMIYLVRNKPTSVFIYTLILNILSGILALVSLLCLTRILDFTSITDFFGKKMGLGELDEVGFISNGFIHPTIIGIIVIVILIYAVSHSTYILRKRLNLKVLMASFGLIIAMNMFLDGNILPQIKKGYSSKPFVEKISIKNKDLAESTYIINDLLKYPNPNSLSFYLRND